MPAKMENLVLDQAMEAFYKETGLRLFKVRDKDKRPKPRELDAVLGVKGHEPMQFVIEVKKWAQHANFGAVVNRMKGLPMKGMLVADYINPEMAQRLRAADIQFMDATGNAYLNEAPIYIYVKGNRKKAKETAGRKEVKTRAFTQTGLKIVFAFLCDPGLVKLAYREIADKAQVALGTVGWVIGDLKKMGYLIDRGDPKTRRLDRYFDLLDIWVGMYPGVLRPKLFLGEFNEDEATNIDDIHIENYEGYWGGEAAGNEYTGYLRGEIDTIYIPEHQKTKLIRDLKLFKREGETHKKVRLFRTFWKKPAVYKHYTHPVLTYADLIATGDVRNIETAKIIKDEHIKPLWPD
jgi:hypothetical protein